MINVDQATMDAMTAPGVAVLKGRLWGLATACYPSRLQDLGPQFVTHLINQALVGAAKAKLSDDRMLARLFAMSLTLGGDLFAEPHATWAAVILLDQSLNEGARLNRVSAVARRLGYATPNQGDDT